MSENKVRVGIVGFGTVGTGVAKILLEKAEEIAAKTQLRLEIGCVVDTNTTSARPVQLPAGILTNNLDKLICDKSITIGVELVGGTGVAKEIQLKMLKAGKDVVTANKALLAEHGHELFKEAGKNGRCIAFEASCAGGIPIISGLRTGLIANDITAMYGILNGTSNYVLSNMTSGGGDFSTALAEAQRRGFAEADPTLDISGGDSSHKLAILSSIAFGCDIRLEDIHVEGIQSISRDDIRYAAETGYRLKLLAIGQKKADGRISLRVHPSFISRHVPLANVEGSFNAITVFGHASGEIMFYGRGAGMMPTASAVVADIIEVATGNSGRTFRQLKRKSRNETMALIDKIDNLVSRYYVRLMCKDRSGVIAQWSKILANHDISISGALQHEGYGPENTVPVVVITHPTQQKNMTAALQDMEKLEAIGGKPVCIRIVDIPEDKD